MAPLTAWLPAQSNKDFDLVVKFVSPRVACLAGEFAVIGQTLADRGLDIMAQTGNASAGAAEQTFLIRVGSRPFYSMGHGFNILVYLGDTMPRSLEFGVQRGTVVLGEPAAEPGSHSVFPQGVIVYPIPFKTLLSQNGLDPSADAFVALGVLLHLLGLPKRSLHLPRLSHVVSRAVSIGFQFASQALVKRDIYAFPLATSTRNLIVLSFRQAVMLGFAIGHCACVGECERRMNQSARDWVVEHVALAEGMVSLRPSPRYSAVRTYESPQEGILACVGPPDWAIEACIGKQTDLTLFMAADVLDALRLLVHGRRLISDALTPRVGVLIEDEVATRCQSVEVNALAHAVHPRAAVSQWRSTLDQPHTLSGAADYDGSHGAPVGYVAWGAAQGVVRDAIALCRRFGLTVAALYPKAVLPLPVKELESFARTVQRVVMVDAGQSGDLLDYVRSFCSFDATVIRPEPGQALTPMDIFLREGLGTS